MSHAEALTTDGNGLSGIAGFLRDELRPYPGRTATVARMLIACTCTMIVVMTLGLPFAFLGVFNALVISRETPEWLVKNGFVVVIANVAGVALALSGIGLFYDYPLAHFLFLLASFFLVFFLKGVLANDNVAFGFGVIVVVTSTFLWDRPYPTEAHLDMTLSLSFAVIMGTVIAVATAWLALSMDAGERTREGTDRTEPQTLRRLFAGDALSNPEYIRFALKGCLAATLCYIFDSAVAWPMVMGACAETCIVTSTPASILGSSRQRLVTRLTALLVGGVILGMGSSALVLPLVDSITGFTVQFVVISALAAWVATSSQRLSYAGTLGAMAYFFTMFQRFGANVSLSRSGDVMVDILVALLVFWLMFDRGLAGGRSVAPESGT